MFLPAVERPPTTAVVCEFAAALSLRDNLFEILKAHNLSAESVDSVMANSLARVLVTNFCISATEANKHPCLHLSNSSIAEVRYLSEPLCAWFIRNGAIVDKLYKLSPGGDFHVEVRVTGARIVFMLSNNSTRRAFG